MTTQIEKARQFAALHIKGDPVILFNIWDAGGAKALAESGAKVVATGSWAVAVAHGYADGEQLPLELAIANLKRIVTSVDLPVTFDMESGYGRSPDTVRETTVQAVAAGAVGVNFEDQIIGESGLYPIDEQAARLRAVRQAADAAGVPLYINARTDVFLKLNPTEHTDAHLEEVVQRAQAFADAGASGLFAPALADERRIAALCERSPLPVNLLVTAHTPPLRRMAELGVARISFGSGSYRTVMAAFTVAARAAFEME